MYFQRKRRIWYILAAWHHSIRKTSIKTCLTESTIFTKARAFFTKAYFIKLIYQKISIIVLSFGDKTKLAPENSIILCSF